MNESGRGAPGVGPAGHYRWVIVALLFFITTVNYMDRNLLGVLKPTIQGEMHFSESDYGDIVFAFSMAYAAGYASMGAFTDRVGIRLGLAVAAVIWSVASSAHGLVTTVAGFTLARILLGLGEGGNFPTCIKAVATWFPVRDRALATGVFNSGSNIGGLLAPLIAAFVTAHFGWQAAFYVTGFVGILWVVFWLVAYRAPEEHPKVSAAELAYIQSDPDVPLKRVPWVELFRYPGTWVYIVGGVLTNPVWWFYNNWVPSFLFSKFNINLMALGLPLVVIYLMTDVGSVGGGWLSGRFIRAGMGVFNARKAALLTCAACTVPVFLAPRVEGIWTAVLLIGLAMAAHQGFSANLFTLVSDTMPKNAVAGAVGLGGGISSVLSGFSAKVVGRLLDATGNNYTLIFFVGAAAYVVATLLIHVLLPRHRNDLVAPAQAPAE
ncbi:MFS transporter [Roseomonas nepalensis]|uniref:MFS transporter n=1 Tax=Muricoccus nepalensis TaxID=1854500 RepID=A0A502FK96_9PROT|nr:MFS transporter [Roseomonas nepalensis]TPG49900.1 MFS transporter [Roseomonas nepalensis]